MQIRKYNQNDLLEIQTLEKEYLTGTFDLNVTDNQDIIVVEDNNKVIAFLYYTYVLEEAEIISIVTTKEYRKKGIGGSLIKELMVRYSEIFLDVKETNELAISFYHSLGFIDYNFRKNFYSDGSNAILMKWRK